MRKSKRLTKQHRQLKELAELIVKHWGPVFRDGDDISGCDAVDSLACYVELAQYALDEDI